MDTNAITEEPILVNFRAPRSLINLLDQVSRFENRTRTSVLLDLISELIREKTQEIPLRVQAINSLKSTLNSHEDTAREISRAVSTKQSQIACRNDSNRFLAPIFSRSSINFNEDAFERAEKW